MDLRTAAKRYEEVRNFWAREMAIELGKNHYRSRRNLLGKIAASATPISAITLAKSLPYKGTDLRNRQAHADNLLRDCAMYGMVTRTRIHRTYWYTISELGAMVLLYMPATDEQEKSHSTESNNGEGLSHSTESNNGEGLSHSTESFDPTKYRLGKLCPHGHEHMGTKKTLRYKQNGGCIVCQYEAKRAKRPCRPPRKTLVAAQSE